MGSNKQQMVATSGSRMRTLVLTCLLLTVTVAAVYWQTGNHQFLNFDDDVYVTGNPHVAGGITGNNLYWAFTSVDAANWHPVTWLSHMADVQFYGMTPRGHHLTSVAIHASATVLLFLLLFRITGARWQSSFVAALFALHPLHVESVAYVTYIGKTLWPHDLAVLYPIPLSFPLWQVIGSLLVLLLVSAATIQARHRYPYLAMGWAWFMVTLVPVIGLVQVGIQAMADRYTYIPLVGLFIMAAWGFPDLASRLKYRAGLLTLLAGAVITTSAVLSWQQLGYWRDNESLYRHTISVTADNYVMHNNLGNVLANRWNLDAAIQEFKKALRIKPNYSEAHYNLGMVFAIQGNVDAAIQELQEALRLNPDHSKAQFNLAVALEQKRWQNAEKKQR